MLLKHMNSLLDAGLVSRAEADWLAAEFNRWPDYWPAPDTQPPWQFGQPNCGSASLPQERHLALLEAMVSGGKADPRRREAGASGLGERERP
jgi:hypothetical protein